MEEVLKMSGIHELEIYVKPGDYIVSPQNSSDRIGHVIARGKDADEAACIADEALKKIIIVYD